MTMLDGWQVALVEQLLEEVWQGEVAVLLNSRWSASEVPADYKAVVESFEVVFSFLPVAIQVGVGSPAAAGSGKQLRHVAIISS
jgi:hypothetical protein